MRSLAERTRERELCVRSAKTAVQRACVRSGLGKVMCAHITFPKDSLGKPRVVLESVLKHSLQVSLSHAYPFVFTAAINSPHVRIGVDIERIRSFTPVFRAAFMTAKELEIVRTSAVNDRHLMSTLCWSAKECVLKAIGCGLRMHPQEVEISEVLKRNSDIFHTISIAVSGEQRRARVRWHSVCATHVAVIVTLL